VKLSYTIFYVADVPASLAFYEKATGLQRKFLHESNAYGELDTGPTTLSFTQRDFIAAHIPGGFQPSLLGTKPLGAQISFEPEGTVDAAFENFKTAGATVIAAPETMPWGFRTAFLRDLDGFIVELAKRI